MKIAVLTGGVGGAKFLLGVKAYLGWDPFGPRPADAEDDVTAIVNTADDIRLHNLHISPDLDSCMYTAGGGADSARGWGRRDETWSVAAELRSYGAESPWFSLGDKDIATHLVRTGILDSGLSLSAATDQLCERWQPGVTLLPMTDDRVETHIVVSESDLQSDDAQGDSPSDSQAGSSAEPTAGEHNDHDGAHDDDPGQGDISNAAAGSGAAETPSLVAIHFQEWWLKYHASIEAMAITPIGADRATPAAGVLAAIETADAVLLAPSNPVVSIGTILAVPGIRDALSRATAPVVGVSPIVGNRPVRGHADACLAAIKVDCSTQGVASHYGARSGGGLLDAFLIAEDDHAEVDGMTIGHAPLLMHDPEATAEIVAAALSLVDVVR